ncbi:MAG: hypothetical protein J0I12_19270 [Candidatus Eremiobacteraeota bacterium]|nr:hypothetical protein [Candidatus Eremiobacteraeota bacterium]
MSRFLEVGDAILSILEGDLDRVEELSTLFALRAELIAALDPTEAEQILRQDRRLHDACTSQLHRLRVKRRFNAYQKPAQSQYVDQHG